MLAELSRSSLLVINPIIYSEVSAHFDSVEELEDALPSTWIRREPLPWESAFLAGRCFVKYRRTAEHAGRPCPTSTSAPTRRWLASACSRAMPGATALTFRN